MHMVLKDKEKIAFIYLERFYTFKKVSQDFQSPFLSLVLNGNGGRGKKIT